MRSSDIKNGGLGKYRCISESFECFRGDMSGFVGIDSKEAEFVRLGMEGDKQGVIGRLGQSRSERRWNRGPWTVISLLGRL